MSPTFTFSRALHNMRYGGMKVRCLVWDRGIYAHVKNEQLFINYNGMNCATAKLQGNEIMASWEEYIPEIHDA